MNKINDLIIIDGGISSTSWAAKLSSYVEKYVINSKNNGGYSSTTVLSASKHIEENFKHIGKPDMAYTSQSVKINDARDIIFVTPIAYNAMSGQTKMFIDSMPFGHFDNKRALVVAIGGSKRSTYAAEISINPVLRSAGMDVFNKFVFLETSELPFFEGAQDVASSKNRLDSLLSMFIGDDQPSKSVLDSISFI